MYIDLLRNGENDPTQLTQNQESVLVQSANDLSSDLGSNSLGHLTQGSVLVQSDNTDLSCNGKNNPAQPTQNFKLEISTRSPRIPKTISNYFLWI
jgi:hypothetical protein